jgi:hypothetical protein
MAKVIKGTKDRKSYKVIKGPADTRQVRCTNQKCKNMAQQVPDGKGGTIYKCLVCGTKFSFTSM